MMKSAFYWRPSYPETILFPGADVHSPEELAITCGAFILVALVFETLKCYRVVLLTDSLLKAGQRSSCLSKAHLVQTALYMIEFVFAYALMLVVMSFNLWLGLAVLTGSAIGYTVCGSITRHSALKVPRPQERIVGPAAAGLSKDRREGSNSVELMEVRPAAPNGIELTEEEDRQEQVQLMSSI